jgi:hypothetical protein
MVISKAAYICVVAQALETPATNCSPAMVLVTAVMPDDGNFTLAELRK